MPDSIGPMFDQTDFIRLRGEWREIKFRRDFEAKWAEPVVPRYDVVRRVALWLMRKRLEDEFELSLYPGALSKMSRRTWRGSRP
jgi:hypothetical protein